MSEPTSEVFRGSGEYEGVVRDVYARTRAGRVTLRLPADDQIFPVYVEVRDGGVLSAGDYAADPNTGTFEYLSTQLQPLVQADCRTASDTPPTVLIEKYGVGAQILAPLVVDGELGGIISVHHIGGAREWSEDEIAAATDAAATVVERLGASGA